MNTNRLLSLSTPQLSTISYGYNSVGNRTSMGRSDASSDSYTYDATDQLTGVNSGAFSTNTAHSTTYAYDPVGNRTVVNSGQTPVTYSANALNQYNRVGSGVLHYDANGNLIQQPGWVYTYDAQNRLIAASSATTLVEFAYDGRNRCVRRTTYSRSSGTPVVTDDVLLYYDGWSLIEERDASGNELARYIHGARVDEVLTMARGGTNYFYHADALGSVTHLTDSTGTNVVERYTYDVFGQPTILNPQSSNLVASAFGNRFAFTGREYLAALNLYDYRYRVYSPTLGRFMQTDPIGFAAGDVNLYRYVGNRPQNFTDWLGLRPGDRYLTLDLAAIAAVRDINPTSIHYNWEYGGYIYKYQDGSYSYTEPVTQYDPDTVNLRPARSNVPKCAEIVAKYHTHGADDGHTPGFSWQDKELADLDRKRRPNFLGESDGSIRKYSPLPGSDEDRFYKGEDRLISHQDPSKLSDWRKR